MSEDKLKKATNMVNFMYMLVDEGYLNLDLSYAPGSSFWQIKHLSETWAFKNIFPPYLISNEEDFNKMREWFNKMIENQDDLSYTRGVCSGCNSTDEFVTSIESEHLCEQCAKKSKYKGLPECLQRHMP